MFYETFILYPKVVVIHIEMFLMEIKVSGLKTENKLQPKCYQYRHRHAGILVYLLDVNRVDIINIIYLIT